ncbi:MAG: hypothetical protein ACKOIA_04210, partial [Acidimicrobiia bacterium]
RSPPPPPPGAGRGVQRLLAPVGAGGDDDGDGGGGAGARAGGPPTRAPELLPGGAFALAAPEALAALAGAGGAVDYVRTEAIDSVIIATVRSRSS